MDKNTPALVKRFAFALALTLLASSVSAAISTWDGTSADGNWDTAGNWDNGVPGTSDQAIISNGDTVTKTGDLTLDNNSTVDDGLQLTNGTLNVTGSFSNTIPTYTDNANMVSQLGVSDGSTTGTLTVGGTYTLGYKSSGSTRYATLDIFEGSSLTAADFIGRNRSYGTVSQNGGWKLNVLGGSVAITDTFNFSDGSESGNGRGIFTIGNLGTATGGTVNIATMSSDWTDLAGHYVLFNDSLGSLTFGKTNYANIADVQDLIDNDFIRKDGGITGGFSIIDNGTSWTVAVPEPGTYALLAGCFALASVMIRRRA